MHGLLKVICCAISLLTATSSLQAADVFRCKDSRGHITFTQNGCPSDQLQQLQSAVNPSPGNAMPVAMASVPQRPKNQQNQHKEPRERLTVVAEKQDGCGNQLVGSQRRTAIIRKQIQPGMTMQDVESSLGKPDEKAIRNGQTQYTYQDNNGTTRQVRFDHKGCVKSKR